MATTAMVFVLIVVGGTVRATNSGLGCPDWPRCHGSFVPKWEKHTLIEYSHRLTASVVGVMVFAVAAWAWKSYRHVRSISLPAAATFVLLLVQGGLGGLTVIQELPPEIVTVHLATALTLFALLILMAVASFAHERPLARLKAPPNLAGLALIASGLALAAMLLGAYVAGAGYSLACNGWPLCSGDVIPGSSSESVQLVFLHRLFALLLGAALLALAVWAARAAPGQVALLSQLSFVVYVLQALVGAANIWTDVSDAAQVGHLAVGTALWGILAFLTIRLYALDRLIDARRYGVSARADLVRAAR